MSGFRVENVQVVHETFHEDGRSKAICISAPVFDEDKWVPQSCVHDDSEVEHDGDEGDLVVKTWFADKEGWVD